MKFFSMIPEFIGILRKNAKITKEILDFSTTTTDAEKVQSLRDLWKVYEVPANAIGNGVDYFTINNEYILI